MQCANNCGSQAQSGRALCSPCAAALAAKAAKAQKRRQGK